jgi:TolB-like protein
MWLVLAPVGMAVAQAGGSAAVAPPPSTETLCVLDFDRLGDDPSLDWLQRGLADMMIGTMNRLSPYRVVERKHLRELLREHGLAASGLIDMDTAVRRARLAKAQVLLLGSFARQDDRLTIQARLIRISDQRILARAGWTDPPSDVLAAPRALSEALLARLGKPADRAQGEGIEHEIPRTIDVAKAYYAGLGAFDDGRYPEALAHYLDAARRAGDFSKVYPAVIEMYTLLGQGEHAVLFARRLARSYEEAGDAPSALEYHFAAAQQCLDALRNPSCAIESLEGLLRAVTRHEEKTGEIGRTKRIILDKIGELHGTGKYETPAKILADRSIRYRVWPGDIDSELMRRAEEQARGGVAVLRDAKWVKEAVPRPSALMWKIRALRTLARAHAGLGATERALHRYRELLDEYEFLSGHPLSDGGHRDPIRTEAHFVLLHHHARTGQLLRNHAFSEINRLNIVENGRGFDRDFGDRRPDARARVASRFDDRGYEYFDFAAPPGHQIDAVTLRATIEGIGVFGFNLPNPAGWPPRFSLSKRVTEFRFSKRGRYHRTVRLPPGVEFLSIGTSWGPGLYENDPAEVRHHQRFGPKDGPDIVRWQASFSVSRKPSATAKAGSGLGRIPGAPMRSAIDRHAAGWESAVVVRQPEAVVYSGSPSLDVYAEDWLVYAIDGDVQIFHRRDPRLQIGLPVEINTREPELEPALVRTHDGGYALLWARGTSTRTARRFVAFSRDLLSWETPQRMVFQDPPDKPGHTRLPEAPAERTTNVVPIRRGYVMLLAQGFARYSEDLRNWGPPRKILPQDLHRNRLVKTRDGTVWAVYESSSDERQPYTPDDWLHGYFVVDGRPYRHVTELRVSRSVDGVVWQAAGKIVVPGQPSGLWAFPVSDRQVGIAVAFNNRFVKWLTASHARDLRQIESPIPVMQHSDEAEFFVRDASLVCARPVLDLEAQQPVLLATSSRALYERLAE